MSRRVMAVTLTRRADVRLSDWEHRPPVFGWPVSVR
jgi:hypothetical protein